MSLLDQQLTLVQQTLEHERVTRFGTFNVETCTDYVFPERWQSLKLPYGVVFGISLSNPIIESLVDRPTRTYLYHYRQMNAYLDRVGIRLTQEIQVRGYRSFPVPSSQIVDWDSNTGHLSHRLCGVLAGLGWIGRNNLLVIPELGSRLRFATVLTDMELPAATPMAFGCGECRACISVCPVEAIHERPEDFELNKCDACLKEFRKKENLGSQICGLCIKACPGFRSASREPATGKRSLD
jgi:epoxyqueuosine reductase QueG